MPEKRGGRRGRAAKAAADKAKTRRRGIFRRKRVCRFCVDKIDYINYKDVRLLMPLVPERGKIQPAVSPARVRSISESCGPRSSEPVSSR